MSVFKKPTLSLESLESRRLLAVLNGTVRDRLDVNADGAVSPVDAVVILNFVNDATASKRSSASFDVNLDGASNAADALMVIDRLNSAVVDEVYESGTPRASALHAALAGDFDADCDVDQQDHDLWASTFGSTTQLAADGNGDGIVDAADFNIWREHRGIRRCSISDTAYWSLTNMEFDNRSLHANADGSVDMVLSREDDIVWEVELDAVSDTVTLKDLDSGLYLGALNFHVYMTANVTDNTRWRIIHHEDGSVLFRNVATGRYLDGDGPADDFNVEESLATDADARWIPNVWVLPSSPAVSFAVIGDHGTALVSTTRMASRVNLAQPDLVLAAGDVRYTSIPFDTPNGIFCDYQSDVTPGPKCPSGGNSVPNRFFAVPGNHDYTDGSGIQGYRDYFNMPGRGATQTLESGSELYYDVVLGPVHLFALDSQAMALVDGSYREQVAWLEAAVAASTAPWQVVMLHHAPFASSPTHGSNGIMHLPYANWGVDLVLAGHIHLYERLERDGTTFVVNGLGGVRQYPPGRIPIEGSVIQYNADHGASFFEATATTLEGSFVDLNGDVIDTFSVSPSVPGQPEPQDDLRMLGSTFVDTNVNGRFDDGESTLSNVVVFVDDNRNNVRDPGEWFTTSNAEGNYEFFFAAPRLHYFNVETPAGFTSTIVNSWGFSIFGPDPLEVDLAFRPEKAE